MVIMDLAFWDSNYDENDLGKMYQIYMAYLREHFCKEVNIIRITILSIINKEKLKYQSNPFG